MRMTIDRQRRDYLTGKYIAPPNTLETAVIAAEAEQHVQTVLDLRRACEVYNGNELEWLTWELPTELRTFIDGVRARLREAAGRDSREAPPGPRASCDSPGILWYDDDRNKYHEQNGWPPYDPDNPHHQTVAFGHIVTERDKVHVLRGAPVPDIGQGYDFGHGYDFPELMRRAEYDHMFRVCDLRLPDGCDTGIGGGDPRLVAVPVGQWVFVLSICETCMAELARSWRSTHPKRKVGTLSVPAWAVATYRRP